MEGNLWEGMYSFDNTLNALVLMFLIITASNWNLLMYRLQETEISYVAPLYFAAGILVREHDRHWSHPASSPCLSA